MPPRYAYWTIIAGGLPTAFRMAEREEILPTFKRILEKHPDAELRYFARGRLWASQEEAKRAAAERREGRTDQPRRGPGWRPGGSHSDPRQPFKDAKKARNVRWRKERFERRQDAQASGDRDDRRPPGQENRPSRQGNRPPWRDSHPPRERERFGRNERPPRENQRFGKDERPLRERKRFDQDRPPREKPHGDPLRREVRPRFEKKPFGPPRGSGRRPPGRPPGKPPRGRS